MHEAAVISNSELAPGVRYLSIDLVLPCRPGQCVSVELCGVSRYYSIASGPGEVGVLYDVISHGELTPRLDSLGAGDSVRVSEPFGSFLPKGGAEAWIATGTGIAPFLAAVRSLATYAAIAAPRILLHGVRSRIGMYFADELAAALGGAYVPCVSRPSESERRELLGYGAFLGRLTAKLRAEPVDPSLRYLLCGGANMVVDVRDLLLERGVAFDNIVSEIYF